MVGLGVALTRHPFCFSVLRTEGDLRHVDESRDGLHVTQHRGHGYGLTFAQSKGNIPGCSPTQAQVLTQFQRRAEYVFAATVENERVRSL